MQRRTKIIASIGPASESESRLREMLEAGMDIARLNLAHDDLDRQLDRYALVRRLAVDVGRPVGVMVDLPGPKVRAAPFPEGGIELTDGALVRLVPGSERSTAEVIEVGYDELLSDVHAGDLLRFGDGGVVVKVLDTGPGGLECEVAHGGPVEGRPGVHIPSDRLRITTPTTDDLRLLDAFIEVGVDMAALSFVRSGHDIRRVGTEPHPRGPLIVAKVETRAAVENLDGIIAASGAVMVARGDLGAEVPIEEVPHLQKRIIHACIAVARPAITATQMLESMVRAPSPTRAEATDVANAVFDGSSALLLSGETAVGHDPPEAVRTMARVAKRADELFDHRAWATRLGEGGLSRAEGHGVAITDAMTMASWRVANETDAAAIICITRSGTTVRSISRFRPEAQILGFSSDERTVRQLTMSWGATPILMPEPGSYEQMLMSVVVAARDLGHVHSGDLVAVLAGSDSQSRTTDVLRLSTVP